jgi:hypothetical protein
MRRRDNPYTPGAGRKPAVLAGRDRDIDNFSTMVEKLNAGGNDRSIIYTGLRGVGKTVLLMEFDVLANDSGWATTDVQEVGNAPDFRALFTTMALRLLRSMSRRHRSAARVESALRVLKAFSVTLPANLVQIKLDVEPLAGKADSGDPEQDLAELLIEIGETAQSGGTGALFVIDEMQQLDHSAMAAICMGLQAVSRKNLPVALVGAGLPDLRHKLLAAKPYADRLFTYEELGGLDTNAAAQAIRVPAARSAVDFDRASIQRILERTAGYPYFLQVYGQEIWNMADESPIGLDDVEVVEPLFRETLARSFFGPRFELATDAEQRYLMAMASLGSGPYRTQEVATAYGAENQRGVSVHRDNLIGKGLIWSPRRGSVDFTVPLFADYLSETHPLIG